MTGVRVPEGDFLVEMEGHCFFCLNKIPTPVIVPPSTKEPESGLPTRFSTPPNYSLQYFSRYLKMDMGSVFSTNGLISPDLLAKVQRAKLKAELCVECASQTERFSELCRQLEKIEMEIGFYVEMFHGKLVTAENGQLSRSTESDLTSKLLGKLEIANGLRNEAVNKCSTKLNGKIAPRVKVKNRSKRQLNDERLKLKYQTGTNSLSNTHTFPVLEPADSPDPSTEVAVKLEPEPCDSPPTSTANKDTDTSSENDKRLKTKPSSRTNSFRRMRKKKRPSTFVSQLDSPDPTTDVIASSPSLSTASDLGQKPGIVPTTPNSRVNPKTGKHKCRICSNEFSKFSNFKRHYRDVHLKIRYQCSLCPKEFTDRSSHSKHLKSEHLGITFKCQVCASTFTQKANLRRHHRRTSCGKGRPRTHK